MHPRRKIVAIILFLAICLSVPLWMKRETLAVHYHLALMDGAWKRISQVGPDDSKQSTYIERYDAHRDALVRQGYFERREFVLANISVPSLQAKRLWQELQAEFSNYPHVTMQGYEPTTTDMITVWDRPESIEEWAEIIRAHDMPPDPVLRKARMSSEDDYTGFVGPWVNGDGDVMYEILDEGSGDLRIKTWDSETWTTVIKNVRAEGKTIFFDRYHYTPPTDKLKKHVSRDGEHPFSGVRCVTELRLVEGDDTTLQQTFSTIHTGKKLSGMLKRQE